MAKNKKTRRSEPFPEEKSTGSDKKNANKQDEGDSFTVAREFVESVVIAIVLALLFRAFEAEAFVIPTGSMAPTLMGRHKDIVDPNTGFEFRVGASSEMHENRYVGPVTQTVDPLYRFPMSIENETSFPGDRILVSKFAYDLSAPARWDVIVFKNPSKPEINYIKRLIGLPGETVKIYHGDIYIKKAGETEFSIARKPAYKQLALLQNVYDSQFPNSELIAAGFPNRLENYPSDSQGWSINEKEFECKGTGEQINWLRYRHILPGQSQLNTLQSSGEVDTERAKSSLSQLITDFNVYNSHNDPTKSYMRAHQPGNHWVGDLAVECRAEVKSNSGVIHLDLVEGGTHFRCSIDVASGEAKLEVIGSSIQFDDLENSELTAATAIKSPGVYDLRFANCDDQLRLWVNNSLVDFGSPATFVSPANVKPKWSESDPGDLLPVGIGSQGLEVKVSNIKVLRDLYYIAVNGMSHMFDYEANQTISNQGDIQSLMKTPTRWSTTPIFDARRSVEFVLEEDQYFPLGDNSAASLDGRLWDQGEQFVPRRLLIGKALLVYWPHSTNKPIPFFPNFRRMRFIR